MNYTIDELKKEYSMLDIKTAEEFAKEAIKKLQAEKCEHALDLIRMLLVLTLAHGDRQLAESIINSKYKSLENCFKHVKKWAKEKATAGCAVLDHEEVLSEAIHYYVDMPDEEEKTKNPCFVPPKPKENTPSLFDNTNEDAKEARQAKTEKGNRDNQLHAAPSMIAAKSEPAKKKIAEQSSLISLF